MKKSDIISFFDALAPHWDAECVIDDAKIERILDSAGVASHSTVLDVACGTGVLFPYYQKRGVSRVIAVDLSPEMARIAASKAAGTQIEVLCDDIEALPALTPCDCAVIYNAFPHFPHPAQLIERIASWVKPCGHIVIAHGMGLKALDAHHEGAAAHVSRRMLLTEELSALLAPYFDVEHCLSDDTIYLVSGVRKQDV